MAIAFLIPQGENPSSSPCHVFLRKWAYFFTRDPPDPKGLFALISPLYLFERKNWDNLTVWLRHYKPLFIKQVFPKFYNPVNPSLELFVGLSSSPSSSSPLLIQRL